MVLLQFFPVFCSRSRSRSDLFLDYCTLFDACCVQIRKSGDYYCVHKWNVNMYIATTHLFFIFPDLFFNLDSCIFLSAYGMLYILFCWIPKYVHSTSYSVFACTILILRSVLLSCCCNLACMLVRN